MPNKYDSSQYSQRAQAALADLDLLYKKLEEATPKFNSNKDPIAELNNSLEKLREGQVDSHQNYVNYKAHNDTVSENYSNFHAKPQDLPLQSSLDTLKTDAREASMSVGDEIYKLNRERSEWTQDSIGNTSKSTDSNSSSDPNLPPVPDVPISPESLTPSEPVPVPVPAPAPDISETLPIQPILDNPLASFVTVEPLTSSVPDQSFPLVDNDDTTVMPAINASIFDQVSEPVTAPQFIPTPVQAPVDLNDQNHFATSDTESPSLSEPETAERGEKGDTGETGETRETGETGETGEAGETGETGGANETSEPADTDKTDETPAQKLRSASSKALEDSDVSRSKIRKEHRDKIAKTFAKDIAFVVIAAFILSIIIKTFVLQPFLIPSASMDKTLVTGDKILVSKLTPEIFKLKRGDVIVFKDTKNWLSGSSSNLNAPKSTGPVNAVLKFVGLAPEDDDSYVVKRLIGLPGDRVSCDGGGNPIVINGEQITDEPYLQNGIVPSTIRFNVTVPDGMFFVMGDNRPVSADSRVQTSKPGNGFISTKDVVGVAFARIWPSEHFGRIPDERKVFNEVPNP